ncbi:Thrombospondin type-1 domain-containing protein 1 [Mactra antiquata]
MSGIILIRILHIVNFIFVYLSLTVCAYQLKLPREYVAFSGDLDVHYQIPSGVTLSNAFIRVALMRNGRDEEITNLGINSRYNNGTQTISCGILEIAGQYEFQMYMYSGGPLLKRQVLIVRWPNITLRLPEYHYAQSSSVHVKYYSSAKCNPKLNRYGFDMILEYAKDSSAISVTGNPEILDTQSFSNLASNNTSIELKCTFFNLSGTYRISLLSPSSAISMVSRSNLMLTSLNPAYKINILSDTIFPCNTRLIVHYTLPQCPGDKGYNKIRIYMLRRKSSGSLAAPVDRLYMKEHAVDPDKTSFLASCEMFKTQAIGYCFQLVSLARHGILINQTEVCLSAHPNSVLPVDGGWGQWSEWSECSTTCGPGEQNRYRMCNSPTPNFGGAFCEGFGVQRRNCDKFCPDDIPMTPLHSPKIDEECACGCHLATEHGEIVASGRCSRTSKWLITVPKHHVIKLTFNYLSLYENKQWVKVRNGDSPSSDLIFFSDGRSNIKHVTSTGNQMLVEFFSEPDDSDDSSNLVLFPLVPTKPIHVHGFIASFSSNRTATTAPVSILPVHNTNEPSIWESTVTIVGIALCGLVVITAISFVIYHRTCHRRLHKYAMAAHEESPKRMCKSTSMPSSTSRESHHGIEIEHDMEIPLTGINGAADKKPRAKTPGSTRSKGSITSACSSGVKKLKTKADIEYGGSCRASPLTPNRDYSQVPQTSSPKRKHRLRDKSTDSEQNMSLFKTSPLTKAKVPRSPKVHPSPRLSKLRSAPNHPSVDDKDSLPTKQDMLSSRFGSLDHGNKRFVMGSDYTPTNSIKSPPSEDLKTDCETPTNIDNTVLLRKHGRLKGDTESDQQKDLTIKGDITLKDFGKSSDAIDRKPASGTSDDSTNSVDKENTPLMTTSFIENGTKPRRPTSLTESYSKMSLASALSRGSIEGARSDTPKDKSSINSSDDRQNALPKPDGQSPKSQRLESVKTDSRNSSPSKTSKTSTPKSVQSLRSDVTDNGSKTKSPARSIDTPSDVIELEYDDFIDMDDTYSYFDPIETEKLNWHGVERVKVKTPKEDKQCK